MSEGAELAALLGSPPARRGFPRAGTPAPRDAHWERALALSRLGRIAEAEAAARRSVALAPRRAGGHALLGLLELQRGRPEQALAALETAVRLADEPAWAIGLRALAFERLGRLDRARNDLGTAMRGGAYAWMLARRADLNNRLGFYAEGLADLRRLTRLLPGNPEPLMQAARFHLEQAQYRRAFDRMGAAIARRPSDGRLYAARAQILFTQHRLPEALRDLRRACTLRPRDSGLEFERRRVEVLLGSPAGGGSTFLRGLERMKASDFLGAAGEFAAASRTEAPELAGRASFYRQVALVLAAGPGAPGDPGPLRLTLCGLGFRHPFQVSAEVVRTLREARIIYSNLSDSRVSEFLALFPAEVRPVRFRRADSQALACARAVARGLRGRGLVALATRGNPLFYGRLAQRLVALARRRGLPCTVPASVSVAELFLSAAGGMSSGPGAQVLDAREIVDGRRFRTDLPVVVYNAGGGPWREGLLKRFRRLYPASHPCQLLAGSGEGEFSPVRVALGALREPLQAADPAVTLLVPGRRHG